MKRSFSQMNDSEEYGQVHMGITKVDSFIKMFELVKKLLIETTLSFSPELGMTIFDSDSSNVAFINMILRPSYFSMFECIGPPVKFIIPLHLFYEALKCMNTSNKNAYIEIKLNEETMTISSKNANYGENTSIKINSRNGISEENQININDLNNLEYPQFMQITSKRLEKMCNSMKSLDNNYVKFERKGNRFIISSDNSSNSFTNEMTFDQGLMIGMNGVDQKAVDCSVTVPLMYVQTVSQAHKLSDHMNICISDSPNIPVVLRYNILSGVTKDDVSMLTIFISPKIEHEEEPY